jgi:DNA-binding transcriptional MerR regulator
MSRLDLPDKIYFKIGEVSEILDLQAHVLRYWESEFDSVRPTKSKSGQRLYRRRDVEILALVQDLLYRQKFTIKGARQYLKSKGVGKALEEKATREQSDHSLFLKDVGKKLDMLAKRTDRLLEKLDRE